MKMKLFIIFLCVSCLACNTDREGNNINEKKNPETEMVFEKAKWKTIDGADYPFRDKMLKDLVYNDTIRDLNKDEILNLLGEPTRTNENYLYYMIAQKRLGNWPLHTKTLVIKFSDDKTIEWIKIHE